MTFDIMGINPLNENGLYLSFNNVSWYPLWNELCRYVHELTKEDQEKGSMNDGLLIDGNKHFAIIRTLDEVLSSGINRYGIDDITWSNLQALLTFCESNEGFRIW
ncbi:MAG: hypothetical protein C4K48_10250 [Candidatus Thorarchaeota archaeon]|nr:MAG: hypothetical protein C4K48_10250 [Candidatus Thorarchaeota archaeon]